MNILLYFVIHVESVLVPAYKTGTLDVIMNSSGDYSKVVTFSQPFVSIPKLLFSWRYVDVSQGPNHYYIKCGAITQNQFIVQAYSTKIIYQISLNWMAFIDDNVFVQYGEIAQLINSESLNVPINLQVPVSYNPNAAFLLNGITQTQTLTPQSAAYKFALNSVSATVIQIQVTALAGYTISWFSYTVVYGSPQYLLTGEQSFNILGTVQLFAPDARIKQSFVAVTSIKCTSNIRIKIVTVSLGQFTSIAWASTIITQLTLSYILYLPCPLFCTTCYATPPNCDGCVLSTHRSGASCTACPTQMFSSSEQINCQQCQSYCNNCSGQSNNCISCKSSTLRSGLPNCTTCPPGMFLEIFMDNCQSCKAYCDTCSGSTSECVSCNQASMRIKPPDCATCADQYHIVPNTLTCQPCLTYCNNCFANTSQCVACSQSSLRINPPDCLGCPEFTYLNGEICTQCGSTCATCDAKGCLTCSNQSSYINVFSQCILCPAHCLSCDINTCNSCAGNCLQCDFISCLACKSDNFYILGTDCIKCPTNCKICEQSICLTCIGPRSVIDNICQCNHPCLTCNSIECLTCISSDYRILSGGCQYCPSNCVACDYLGNCLSGPDNCNRGIFDGQQFICTQCNQSYYLDDNVCNKCSSLCLECIIHPQNCTICRYQSVAQQECQFCEYSMGFYSNYQDKTCFTSCGDAIVAGNEQCDDGNSVSNDGCSNCKVDQGYSCSDAGCFKIIYPIPVLTQQLLLDSPYNRTKIFHLTYNTPIQDQVISITLLLIPSIEFSHSFTYIDNKTIKVQLNLSRQLENGKLEILFNNHTQIKSVLGVQQQLQYLQSDISNYFTLSDTEQDISDFANQFINILLILLIILIALGILFGGLDIFWNLLDLLQVISYLKYINTVKPQYLDEFLNLFGFIQFQNLPINSFLNTQNFVKNRIDLSDHTTPPALIFKDDFSSSTLLNIIPIMNVLFAGILIFICAKLIFNLMRIIDIAHLALFINKLKISIFIYDLSQYILTECSTIQKQWFWSGLIRIFISSCIDICFMVCLGIYGLQFENPKVILRIDLSITIFSIIGFLSITYIISNIGGFCRITLLSEQNIFGAVFESLRLNIWTKYYNIILIHKNFLFMIFLVLLYNEPIFQISSIILIQITQIIFLLSQSPIKEQIERNKQCICQMLMLCAEIQLLILVLDDYLILFKYNSRDIFGWICLFSIVLVIITQLCMDAYQQYKRLQKKYQFIKKLTKCISCKASVTFEWRFRQ